MNYSGNVMAVILFLSSVITAGAGVFDTDTFRTRNGQEVIITFIKHGSLMLTVKGKHIQVDPVSAYADYSLFPKAAVILVTHEHGDHLDAKAIEQLTGEGTVLVTNEACRKILGKGQALKNGEETTILDDIRVEAVPAYNITPGREQFHPRHRDNGYVLTIDGLRIYIAGDTEDIPELAERKAIDIAFLPVNQPYTMTVEQAIRAARVISPKVFYPYHYGDTPIEAVKEGLTGTDIDVRIREMQ